MLKRFILSSFDHIIFTIGFILGVQLPEFLQQYTQLINGKLAEAKFHLSKYQSVADMHFNGDIKSLVIRYSENSDPVISHTGQVVAELIDRVTYLDFLFQSMTQGSYVQRLYCFVTQYDAEAAQLTAAHYVLAIPVSIEALVTGMICSIIIIFTRLGLFSACDSVYCKLLHKKQTEML